MKNIRDGNDIHFVWAVTRGGQPEDLTSLINAELILKSFNKKQSIPFTIVDTNKIGVELKRSVLDEPGLYNLEFSYTIPDTGFSDGVRACAVDVDPFSIVINSKTASEASEYTMTSEMAIAFKGDKGDPFTYDDFTPEQIEALKIKGDKGEAFTFADFTPEQIEGLKVKGDTGPMADIEMTINESGELIANIKN